MTDAHAHLDTPGLLARLDSILENAKTAGVHTIINVGEGVETSRASIALAEKYKFMYATVGVHPEHAKDFLAYEQAEPLESLLHNPKVKAVGEIGLDYHWIDIEDRDAKTIQKQVFQIQMEMARQYNLPVMVHSRDAAEDTFALLEQAALPKVIMHCYAYDVEWAEKFLALNPDYLISLTGIVTFPSAEITQEVARRIPLDHITLETDCPFLAPQKYRGQTNEPAFVVETARKVAELKGIALGEVEQKTDENVRRFFGIDK